MKLRRNFLRDGSGAAALEMGLLAPLLVILLVGVAELGRAVYQHQVLSKSVRDATRYLTRVPNPDTNLAAQAIARNLALRGSMDGAAPLLLGADTAGKVTLNFSFPTTGSATGFHGYSGMIETTMTYPFVALTGFAFSQNITIGVRHVERYIGE